MRPLPTSGIREQGSARSRTLAERMGTAIHQSPLRHKIARLMNRCTPTEPLAIEDWLVDLANQRGANVVFREAGRRKKPELPSRDEFSDEELVVALCQLNCADRPQLLRLPAQLISRNELDIEALVRHAALERAGRVLRELAMQALKVDPQHPAWRTLAQIYRNELPLAEPLIHWTRLAEPVFVSRSGRPSGWNLVAG